MNSARGNFAIFAIFALFLALATASGVSGYLFPKAALAVTDTVVTSLSILFGLSMAVYSLASRRVSHLGQNRPNDPLIDKQIKEDIRDGNELVLSRQNYLLSLFLFSIIIGIAFKAFEKIPEAGAFVPIISSLFSFTGALSLLGAFFLPGLLLKLHQRNQHFDLN